MSEPTDNRTIEYSDKTGVAPEWGTDPVDQPYTPERVMAIWIQATSTVETYLASDRADLARNMIDELDTNLRDFAEGGYPPGSDEMAGIYSDAIYRTAVPYGNPPISAEEVARQLNNVGFPVPPVEVDAFAARTGITPLSPEHTVKRIDGDFAGAWEQAVGNSYSQAVSHGPVRDYGFSAPAITVSIGETRDWDSTFRVTLKSDGSTSLTVSGDDPVDLDTISQTTGLPEDEVRQIITGATTALRSTLPSPEVQPVPEPALVDLAAARMSVRRAIASITEDSEAAQTHLQSANTALTEAVEALRPDQIHPGVTAAHESVQQASEKVAAVTETASKTDAEVTLYTKNDCPGCFATKRALDKAGVEYEEINLEQNPELLAQFKRQGMMQAPIVETKDGERWAGYNPAKLKENGLDYRSRQQRTNDSGPETGHGR